MRVNARPPSQTGWNLLVLALAFAVAFVEWRGPVLGTEPPEIAAPEPPAPEPRKRRRRGGVRPVVAPAPEPPRGSAYTDEEIAFFLDVALGAEYGGAPPVIRKWLGEVRVAVTGVPTEADRVTLEAIVRELNGLQRQITLVLDDREPQITIHFEPTQRFSEIEPNYVAGNPSFFWVWWSLAHDLYRGRILVDTGLDQRTRDGMLHEELAQALGLFNAVSGRPESVFDDSTDEVPVRYAPIDRTLVGMLYRPEVQRGMTREEVARVLRSL